MITSVRSRIFGLSMVLVVIALAVSYQVGAQSNDDIFQVNLYGFERQENYYGELRIPVISISKSG
jgi:hypothetical protein